MLIFIENFLRVSKAIDVLNLAEIRRYKNNSELDMLKDKNVLMLIGKSGVGKTTFLFTSMGIELRSPARDQF
jgi:flagellar biosynthesis GTPase FlhF